MSDVLKPTGNVGEFVKTLQGKTGIGFQPGFHVHKDWFAKTLTFDQAFERLESARGERVDYIVNRSEISAVVINGVCKIKAGDHEFDPTDHALSQLCTHSYTSTFLPRELRSPKTVPRSKKGVKTDEVLFERDEQDAQALAIVLNNGIRRVDPDKKFRLRTHTDGTMRAYLTESFLEIDNRKYLEIIKSIIPDGRLSHFRGDADEIWGNVLIPDTIMNYPDDDSDYGGMINCSNSEIGTGSVVQMPSVFRSVCLNGNIWDQQKGDKAKWVHRGSSIDYVELGKAMHDNITKQIPLLTDLIEMLQTTKQFNLEGRRVVEIVTVIAKEQGLTPVQAKEIVVQFNAYESEHRNGFGVINAITRAGQQFEPRTCQKFDLIGGAMFSKNVWDAYVAKAAHVTEKDVSAVFGMAV